MKYHVAEFVHNGIQHLLVCVDPPTFRDEFITFHLLTFLADDWGCPIVLACSDHVEYQAIDMSVVNSIDIRKLKWEVKETHRVPVA